MSSLWTLHLFQSCCWLLRLFHPSVADVNSLKTTYIFFPVANIKFCPSTAVLWPCCLLHLTMLLVVWISCPGSWSFPVSNGPVKCFLKTNKHTNKKSLLSMEVSFVLFFFFLQQKQRLAVDTLTSEQWFLYGRDGGALWYFIEANISICNLGHMAGLYSMFLYILNRQVTEAQSSICI